MNDSITTLPRLSLLYDVHRIAKLAQQVVDGSLADHPLTGSEFAAYSLLAASGPVTVSEVADGLGSPMATTSKLLARMETRGHLVKVANPSDGRSNLVDLSTAGRRVHAKARPAFVVGLRKVKEDLTGVLPDVEWCLARLDAALRHALGEPSATGVETAPEQRNLTYRGAPLTAEEEREVRDHIEWLRWRRGRR